MSKVYLREGSDKYYFKYVNELGKRVQKCTGETNRAPAEKYVDAFLASGKEPIPEYLFQEILDLYKDTNTNPKYQECLLDGRQYSIGFAKQVVRYANLLDSIFSEHVPDILKRKISTIDRQDLKRIKQAILNERGKTRTSEQLLQLVKVIFAQAADDGYIQSSPATGLSQIRHHEERRISMDPELISWLIQRQDLFGDLQEWAYFTLVATTGMRKGEALAFDTRKLDDDGIYVLDQKVSVSGNPNSLEPPKMGVVRVIPLPKIALDAIKKLGMKNRIFYRNGYWVQGIFDHVRAAAIGADPKNKDVWRKMTAHVLRHSVNTNLIIANCPKLLVATYLAWEHQDLKEIQARYTHLMGKSLQPVADALDSIYDANKIKEIAFNA